MIDKIFFNISGLILKKSTGNAEESPMMVAEIRPF
jgi:hypothetical protein